MLANYDLLTIGDCSIDLFMKIPDTAALQEEKGASSNDLPRMCFYHGNKIMVESFQTAIAGNAVNVAVGTTLLGLKTAVYSETGDDSSADRIIDELRKQTVDTTLINKNPGTETALHAIIVFSGERTIFSYHGKRNYTIQNWGKPKFIYYTSLGEGFEHFQKELVAFKNKNHNTGFIFNPGTLHMTKGVGALKDVLTVTDILIVNKEEAEKLTNSLDAKSVEQLHKDLQELGPKLTAITHGDMGASAFDGNRLYAQDSYSDERPVVDKTGAGDAFSAGFVSAIVCGKSLEEALKWGVVNAGFQIKVVGAAAGMLTRTELAKII